MSKSADGNSVKAHGIKIRSVLGAVWSNSIFLGLQCLRVYFGAVFA